MKSKQLIIIGAFAVGVVGGVVGNDLVKPSHAASNVIEVKSGREMAQKCDFNKTIVASMGLGIFCVQK